MCPCACVCVHLCVHLCVGAWVGGGWVCMAVAFAGLGFLSLYLAGKLRLRRADSPLWKLALVLAPLVGAYLIAISRVCNYVHHWQDVLVGGAFGTQPLSA
jgi:hypothetical protein